MSSCAVHLQSPVAAYCRTCGTALCEICARSVKGIVYCENCLAERLQAPEFVATEAGSTARPVVMAPVRATPSPGLAAVLAIFFPFGIGQVYTGLYSKGVAHLLIFTFLVWGAANAVFGMEPIFGLGIAFFYFYQIIDAYKSAEAIQLGRPAPDPFNLGSLISLGDTASSQTPDTQASNLPIGAMILIGLGVLFLLSNLGFFHLYWVGRRWPAVLIVLGIWLLMRRRPSGRPTPQQPPVEEVRHD